MTHATSALRVNAIELLRSPGASRPVEVALPADALAIADPRVAGDVDVALTARSSVDGITVHGTASTPWRAQCRRCLVDIAQGTAVAEVDEVFQHEPRLDDAVEIVGDQIDLDADRARVRAARAPRGATVPRRLRRHLPAVRRRPQRGDPARATTPPPTSAGPPSRASDSTIRPSSGVGAPGSVRRVPPIAWRSPFRAPLAP